MKNKIFLFVFLMLNLNLFLFGQQELGIGQWRAHLPYQSFRHLTQSESKIIYATEWSILVIDKVDHTFKKLSKVEGLSDTGISTIKYDQFNDQLIIAYQNSNIDIVKGDQVINLPNIKSSRAISGDRMINNIHIADAQHAYLSTGFGVVELDLQKYVFGFTSFTGFRVEDVQKYQQSIFLASADGIYSIQLDDNANPGDFNNWKLLQEDEGLPFLYESRALAVFEGILYATINNSLHKYDGVNHFQSIHTENSNYNLIFLSAEGNRLIAGFKDQQSSSKVLFFDTEDQFIINGNRCTNRLTEVLEDQYEQIWYADEYNDLRMAGFYDEECTRLKINSPFSHLNSEIAVDRNKVYVASGGVSENFNVISNRFGIYILEENSWENINESNHSDINNNNLINFFKILPHPEQEKVYAGTYWAGLMEYDEKEKNIQVFNKANSSLGGVIGDEQRVRISGLAFDEDSNLWISNFLAAKPLSVYTSEGIWHNFSVHADRQLTEIAIDEIGYKWIGVFGNRGGLLVYDSGDKIEDPTDDRQRFINSSNSELTNNSINALAVDLNGSVWVGTAEGPVVFDCGPDVFSSECKGRRIKVLQDSIPAFLLADVEIRDIEIDGGNRKWFGTRNGIFVQSPNGESEELRFTTENSPLIDNDIIDLGYNGESGEMFIGTNKGIQSYRSRTTSARRTHSNQVLAFPNPVPPEYVGSIAIEGLARDAYVKITDINGVLVYETLALGGLAVWNGKNFNGTKVASGVYLVFSSTTDNFYAPDSYVTKIMVLK